MKQLQGAARASSRDRGGEELLGDLEGPLAVVDRRGTVTPIGEAWSVGWAVGAEDRWHVAEEAAVRSELIDDMPVTAAAMRVPGGDVVLRAAAGRAGPGRAVALEFSNETPVPVSLAVAVTGSIKSAAVRGSRLLADGRAAVDLGRAPGGAAAVGDGEVWPAVRAGPPAGDCEARSRAGLAAAAAVLPLAPRVPLRVTLPVEGESAGDAGPPAEIATGWRAVVARAASVDLPDGAAVRAWRRGIAASILAAGGAQPEAAARAAIVLDRVGLPDEADRARAVVAVAVERSRLQPEVAVAALRALASRRLRAGRDSGLAEWAGPLAAAAGDRLDPLTLEQVAAALEAEAPAPARDAHRLLPETPRDSAPRPAAGDGLAAAVRDGIAFGGDGLAGIEAALDCLAAEAPDHLVVGPALPSDWKGAPLDVRGLATRHGLLSFSVRWHGRRPALLWELVPPTQRPSVGRPLPCAAGSTSPGRPPRQPARFC